MFCFCFNSPLAKAGEIVDFDGTIPGMLRTIPQWAVYGSTSAVPNSLAPTAGVNNNTVTVSASVTGAVLGGLTSPSNPADTISGNRVNVVSGTISKYIVGGASEKGVANGNSVVMSGGIANGGLMGGLSTAVGVLGNRVTITGGTVNTGSSIYVIGGKGSNGDAVDNHVVIGGSANVGANIYGGFTGSATGNAIGNSVVLEGSAVITSALIYGGFVNGGSGSAFDNTVTVKDSVSVTGPVYGGKANVNGTAYNNKVLVSGGTLKGDVSGSLVNLSLGAGKWFNNNRVQISGGMLEKSVYALYLGSGNNLYIDQNIVDISGGVVGQDVYAAYMNAGSGTFTDNFVNISGGTVQGNVYGINTDIALALGSNGVLLSGGQVTGDIYGVLTYSAGKAMNSNVYVTGTGDVGGSVYGGYAATGTATAEANTVLMDGGTVSGNIYGGYVDAGTGPAADNTVVLSGGSVTGNIYGGYVNSAVAATGNLVQVSGGGVTGNIYGGYAAVAGGTATGNLVEVSSGNVTGNVHGGYAAVAGVSATGNAVYISGGTLAANTYGGYAAVAGGTATGNTVHVSGGNISANIYGGFVNAATGAATGNSVVLSGNPIFGAGTVLYGGGGSDDVFTGNSLLVTEHIGSHVSNIKNFEFFRFILTEGSYNSMLTSNTIDLTSGGSAISRVDWLGMAGGTAPVLGERYVLLEATGSVLGSYVEHTLDMIKGLSVQCGVLIRQEGNEIVATLVSACANPQTKVLSEGRSATLAFLGQGTDLLASQGIASAMAATTVDDELLADGKTRNLVSFAAMSGGKSRYNTGSHVDVDGLSMMTGLGKRVQLEHDSLLWGVFFEAGFGSYESSNNFSGSAALRGSGDSSYHGVGVFTRYDVGADVLNGLYAEGSLRTGRTSTDFSSTDLQDYAGNSTSYDSSAAYYGAHVGVGYVLPLDGQTSLDVFSRYMWTHQEGDSILVGEDPVHFDSADSHRWRNGFRLSHETETASGAKVRPYAGASFDYEFDGKACGSTYGYGLPAPELRGGTGMLEVGFSTAPSKNSGLLWDFGLQGYVGQREGVSGSLQLKYEF